MLGGETHTEGRRAQGRRPPTFVVVPAMFGITAATLKGMPRYPGRNTPSTSGRPIPAIRLARQRWTRVTVCLYAYRIIERISARRQQYYGLMISSIAR